MVRPQNPRFAGLLSQFSCKTWIRRDARGAGAWSSTPGTCRLPRLGRLEPGPTWAERTGPRPGTELAAGRSHREHRRRSAVDDREAIVTLVAAGAAMAATVRSEDEAGEEDHRDDEHHSRDDADPGGGGGHLGRRGGSAW